MSAKTPDPRLCTTQDLIGVNRVITAGIEGWNLSERVKRLSLPLYQYRPEDLDHLRIMVMEADDAVVAVAAWEPAPQEQVPGGKHALLLHGLYVHPDTQRKGLGRRLLMTCAETARAQGFDGVLVKAQQDSAGFFEACRLQKLPVEQQQRDYQHRYWLPTDSQAMVSPPAG